MPQKRGGNSSSKEPEKPGKDKNTDDEHKKEKPEKPEKHKNTDDKRKKEKPEKPEKPERYKNTDKHKKEKPPEKPEKKGERTRSSKTTVAGTRDDKHHKKEHEEQKQKIQYAKVRSKTQSLKPSVRDGGQSRKGAARVATANSHEPSHKGNSVRSDDGRTGSVRGVHEDGDGGKPRVVENGSGEGDDRHGDGEEEEEDAVKGEDDVRDARASGEEEEEGGVKGEDEGSDAHASGEEEEEGGVKGEDEGSDADASGEEVGGTEDHGGKGDSEEENHGDNDERHGTVGGGDGQMVMPTRGMREESRKETLAERAMRESSERLMRKVMIGQGMVTLTDGMETLSLRVEEGRLLDVASMRREEDDEHASRSSPASSTGPLSRLSLPSTQS